MTEFIKMIHRTRSGIVTKLIKYILLFSVLITLIGTGLQLFLDYKSEIKSINNTFRQIELSYKKSIVNSLWVTDIELLRFQLEGILQLPDIQFVEVRKQTGTIQAFGTPQYKKIIEHTIPLFYVFNEKDVFLGDLYLVSSLKTVYTRIVDKIMLNVSIQLINIFFVSLFIFIFFYQLVGRHIISMASIAKSIRFDMPNQIFQLNRKTKTKYPDELDQLVTSINLMQENLTHDINLRRIAEKELQESEKRYQSLYDDSPDMYVSVSPTNATVLQCNKTLIHKTDYSREELVGSSIFNIYHDECKEDVKIVFKQLNENNVIRDKELILKRKNGSKIYVSLNVSSVKDDSGKILHFIFSWRDITKRKKVEDELKKYHEHLEELVKERTTDLELKNEELLSKNKELEKYNQLYIDREFRIKELREKVKELEKQI